MARCSSFRNGFRQIIHEHILWIERNAAAYDAGREFFEDQSRVEAREAGATMLFAHVNAAEAKPRQFLQHIAVQALLFPARCVGAKSFLREAARGFDDKVLVFRSAVIVPSLARL